MTPSERQALVANINAKINHSNGECAYTEYPNHDILFVKRSQFSFVQAQAAFEDEFGKTLYDWGFSKQLVFFPNADCYWMADCTPNGFSKPIIQPYKAP